MGFLGYLGRLFIDLTLALESKWFSTIYMTQFTVKMILLLALQVAYIRLEKAKDAGDRSVLVKLQTTTQWLQYISPLVPQLSESSLLCYLLLVTYSNPIILGMIPWMKGFLLHSDDVHFFNFLNDPLSGQQKTRRKLDCILIDMQRSNVNCSDFLLSYSIQLQKLADRKDSTISPTTHTLVRLMAREYGHLYQLRLDKIGSNVWPENRRKKWLNHLTAWYPNILVLLVTAFVGPFQLITYLTLKYSHDWRAARNLQLEASWIRSWTTFDLHFSMMYYLTPIVTKLIALIFGAVDQINLLQSFKASAQNFTLKSALLRNCDDPKAYDQLRTERNQDAIETYIKLRYFVDELQPLLHDQKLIISHFMTPSIFPIALALYHCNDMGQPETILVIALVFLIILTFNVLLLFAAAFRAHCSSIIRLSCSVLYCSLVWPSDLGCKQQAADDLDKCSREDDEQDQDDLAALVQCCHLSPHVRLLWERLIDEEQFVNRKLTCRVFGFYAVDYDSVLRYNIYLFSLLMLYFKF